MVTVNAKSITLSVGGEQYEFFYSDAKNTGRNKELYSGRNKELYFGQFKKKAPEGLRPNTSYCLKRILARDPSKIEHAASRECYETLVFQGHHQREILWRNAAAEAVATYLKNGTWPKDREEIPDCVVIEPHYCKGVELAKALRTESEKNKLRVIRQIACGSEELSLSDNKLSGARVLAHRDAKWGNVVYEIDAQNNVHVRFVDYASIVISKDAPAGVSVNSDGTLAYPMSRDNTSLELIKDGGVADEKTDVYAIGMMMASLFLKTADGNYANPNKLLLETCWHDKTALLDIRRKFERFKTFDTDDSSALWFETALKEEGRRPLQWTTEREDIRQLVKQATRLESDKRISRRELICKLIALSDDGMSDIHVPMIWYLVDTNGTNEERYFYCRAATQLFEESVRKALSDGTQIPKACLCAYPNGKAELIDNEDDLCEAIGNMTFERDAQENHLALGFWTAFKKTADIGGQYRFTGDVYVLTSACPARDDAAPLMMQGEKYDIEMLFDQIYQRLMTQLNIRAVCAHPPLDGVEQWLPYLPVEICPTEHVVPDPSPSLSPTQNGVYYITLPDGSTAYVGRLENT